MPIPTEGKWPPPEFVPAYNAFRDWDAWNAGTEKLRKVYTNRAADGRDLPPSLKTRASQYSGGIVGAFSRWLWGNPPPAGQKDGRLHVGLPNDLSRTAAGLLFSEPLKLTAADEKDTAFQKRLDELIEGGLTRMYFDAASANSVLGDVYVRPVIDEEVMPGKAFLAPVHADGAIPVIRWGHLVEVTFWQTMLVDGSVYFRLLEHHEKGAITYRLHEGTQDELGKSVPLTRLAATKIYAKDPYVNGVFDTKLDRLDVVRIPNAGPQRMWRTDPTLKYLGVSDFDGNEQFFDRADEVWTSWMKDLRLAKGKVILPEFMLQNLGPGAGAIFNDDQEMFRGVSAPMNQSTANPIQAVQFEIRHEAHKATLDALFETALRHAGLSSSTFSDNADVTKTATEVHADITQSSITRGVRIQTYTPAIADSIELLTMTEAKHFGKGAVVGRPGVTFADGVTESPKTVAETVQLINAAAAASKYTLVKMLNPDWREPQVLEELERMKKDITEFAPPAPEFPGDELGPPNGPPKPGEE